MADLRTIIERMQSDGSLQMVTGNPLAQFGTAARRYVGAELLPERAVDSNNYTEDKISYRTVIANSGTRYSPAQKKGGIGLVGSFEVALGTSDIARELTGREFDALQRLANVGNDIAAAASYTNWVDVNIVRALQEYTEQQRWQAIVDAEVIRTGSNGYSETITYPNPAGHRAAAGGSWSSDSYDPYDDILAMSEVLRGKGYRVTRIITSSSVISLMAGNEKVAQRTGSLQVNASGQIVTLAGFATRDAMNQVMVSSGLPPFEVYDLTYRTEDGTRTPFLTDDAMVLVAESGQDESIVFNDATKVVSNVLGYSALGVPTGYSDPQRAYHQVLKTDKPPRLEAQGWQETLPVITEPEAIAVITGIA